MTTSIDTTMATSIIQKIAPLYLLIYLSWSFQLWTFLEDLDLGGFVLGGAIIGGLLALVFCTYILISLPMRTILVTWEKMLGLPWEGGISLQNEGVKKEVLKVMSLHKW